MAVSTTKHFLWVLVLCAITLVALAQRAPKAEVKHLVETSARLVGEQFRLDC